MTSPEDKPEAGPPTDLGAGLHIFTAVTDERGPGPTLVVKDNIDVRGIVTAGGSIPEPGKPPARADAWAVARMREAGYRVIGKTNMHEHGLGSTSQNPHYGAVGNPHDPARISGGSSGGSAAAVAAGISDLALGTDTGGSIRIPSALCGVVGVRPTFGRIPVEGSTPLAHTLDVVGPIAPDVGAAIEALHILEALPEPSLEMASGRLRLVRPKGWVSGLDEGVADAWARIEGDLEPVDVGSLDDFVGPGLTTLYAESAANHGRQLRERPESLGDDVRVLLEQGTGIPATEYIDAQRERLVLRDRIDRALAEADALVLPTTRCVAPRLDDDPLALRDLLTPFTRPFGLTGHPVLALPIRSEGLPVGIQVVGRRGGEEDLMRLGLRLEREWGRASA